MLVALLRTLNQAQRRCPAAMRCLLQERAHRECISASESASLPPRQRKASRTQSNATQRNAAPAVHPLANANAVVCVSLAAAAAAPLSRLADILTPSLSRGPQSAPAALVPAATIGGRREACSVLSLERVADLDYWRVYRSIRPRVVALVPESAVHINHRS